MTGSILEGFVWWRAYHLSYACISCFTIVRWIFKQFRKLLGSTVLMCVFSVERFNTQRAAFSQSVIFYLKLSLRHFLSHSVTWASHGRNALFNVSWSTQAAKHCRGKCSILQTLGETCVGCLVSLCVWRCESKWEKTTTREVWKTKVLRQSF